MNLLVSTRRDVEQNTSRVPNSRRNKRKGATLVEFAIVAPVLFLLIFGLFEMGRVVMVEQLMTNAAREGARRGILESSTNAGVQQTVEDYLTSVSISDATVTVTPADLNTVGFGDPVVVKVSVPFEKVSWIPTPWIFSGLTLSGQSSMRGERPE